jgi:hypothetical protein
LLEGPTPEAESLYSALSSPVTSLNAGRHAHLGVRQGHGTKNQPLPRRLFETGLSLLDRRIFFQCGLQNRMEGYGAGCVRETKHENRHEELNNSG